MRFSRRSSESSQARGLTSRRRTCARITRTSADHVNAERHKMCAMRSRIAVLASGGGSNLQAILDYFDRLGERRGGDIVLVASDRADAGALERAARRAIVHATHSTPKTPDAPALGAL